MRVFDGDAVAAFDKHTGDEIERLLRAVYDDYFGWIAYDGAGPDGISSSGLFYAYARARVRILPPSPDTDVILTYDSTTHTWRASIARR